MKPILGTYTDSEKPVVIDVARLLETRMLIQANSGNGKSRALRRLSEQAAGKVQQLIVDHEGEYASLREKFDLVVCAASGADVAVHPRTASLLARRLLETEVSAVLDVSELKSHERHAFVRLFLESLIEAPKSLRHSVIVTLDEAQVYAPEKGQGESEATAAVIDVATRGRKRGLCLVAATQRISMLHKAVAGECKNRLIGGTSLDVDVKRAAFDLGMTPKEALDVLRALEPGHFFAFGPAFHQLQPREMVTGEVVTTHPKVGHRQMVAPPKPTPAILAMLPKLADLPKEAETEARTLEDLRRELITVRRELTQARKATVVGTDSGVSSADLRAAHATIKRLHGAVEGLMKFVIQINATGFAKDAGVDPDALRKAIDSAVTQAMKLVDQKLDAREKSLQALQREGGRLIANIQKLLGSEKELTIAVDVKHNEPFTVSAPPARPMPPAPRTASSNGDGSEIGTGGKRRIMIALAQYPDGISARKLSILTDLSSRSGTWSTYLSDLRGRGFIEGTPDRYRITTEGLNGLGIYEPLPTGDALIAYWRQRLGQGGKLAIFNVVVDAYPDAVSVQDVADRTHLSSRSGTWSTYLSELRGLGLIDGRKELRATEDLFV